MHNASTISLDGFDYNIVNQNVASRKKSDFKNVLELVLIMGITVSSWIKVPKLFWQLCLICWLLKTIYWESCLLNDFYS